MGRRAQKDEATVYREPKKRTYAPAMTPEGREKQLISLAMNLVEERLRNGTASSQEIVTVLKMGSQREKLERDNLEQDVKLKKAKTEAIEGAKEIEKVYARAIEAMKAYSGNQTVEEDAEEDE